MLTSASGAGCYDNPIERDPHPVLQDVINEYVSLEKASEDYGVVIDTKHGEIDEKATKNFRELLSIAQLPQFRQ